MVSFSSLWVSWTAVSCPFQQGPFAAGAAEWTDYPSGPALTGSTWQHQTQVKSTHWYQEGYRWLYKIKGRAGQPGPEPTATYLPWALPCHLQAMRSEARGSSNTGHNSAQGTYEFRKSKIWESDAKEAKPRAESLSLFSPLPHQGRVYSSCSGPFIINSRPVSFVCEGQEPGRSCQRGEGPGHVKPTGIHKAGYHQHLEWDDSLLWGAQYTPGYLLVSLTCTQKPTASSLAGTTKRISRHCQMSLERGKRICKTTPIGKPLL